MVLKKWEDIPEDIKSEYTYKYYQILRKKYSSLIVKRIFDIIISLALLIVLLPIFVIIAICIKIDSKGPIFYRQERVTQYNRNFKIFKFRTMVKNADKIGSLITIGNDVRITRVGKFIRKCRLDEIPQLINILLGDMSFVGTRPEVRKYVDEYTDEMKATLLMPAGVTSEASIKYRSEDKIINYHINRGETLDNIYINKVLPEKMKYNLEYIINFDFIKDIKLMLSTVIAMIHKNSENVVENQEHKNIEQSKEKERI